MNTLARHELYVAIYYTKIGSHIAAINRSKFIIENYPNSSSIPDGLDLMAYNYDANKCKSWQLIQEKFCLLAILIILQTIQSISSQKI